MQKAQFNCSHLPAQRPLKTSVLGPRGLILGRHQGLTGFVAGSSRCHSQSLHICRRRHCRRGQRHHTLYRRDDLSGIVEVVERRVGVSYIYMSLANGDRLVIAEAGTTMIQAGDQVGCALDSSRLHLFDDAGQAV